MLKLLPRLLHLRDGAGDGVGHVVDNADNDDDCEAGEHDCGGGYGMIVAIGSEDDDEDTVKDDDEE